MIFVGQLEFKIMIEILFDGVIKIYEFGKEVVYNDGLLLGIIIISGGNVVCVDWNSYYFNVQLFSVLFLQVVGCNLKYGVIELGEYFNCLVQSIIVQQDGVLFICQVQMFDVFICEVVVVEFNNVGFSCSSSMEYYDNVQLWVCGQIVCGIVNGIEQLCIEFDGNIVQWLCV